MKFDWPKTVFISEEIANQIKIPPLSIEPVKTVEERPKTPHIINHNIKANVWTQILLPKDIEGWQMSCRDDYDIEYCFEPSGSTYKTLRAGGIVSEDTSPVTINAIYVRCVYNTTIEVELWKT